MWTKNVVDNCAKFWHILCVVNKSAKLTKFSISILKSVINSKYAGRDLLTLGKEIVEQDSGLFMRRLNDDFVINKIPLEDLIDVCTNAISKLLKIQKRFIKVELKVVLLHF